MVEGSVEATVEASAGAVFEAITDVGRLPEWNDRIEALESTAGPLDVGDRWTVRMRLPGKPFSSVSEVLELDRGARHFVHRSKPDDANPSHTVWTWDVADEGPGRARVRVAWSIRPATPMRRVAAMVRRRMIPGEAAASLARLAELCRAGDRA